MTLHLIKLNMNSARDVDLNIDVSPEQMFQFACGTHEIQGATVPVGESDMATTELIEAGTEMTPCHRKRRKQLSGFQHSDQENRDGNSTGPGSASGHHVIDSHEFGDSDSDLNRNNNLPEKHLSASRGSNCRPPSQIHEVKTDHDMIYGVDESPPMYMAVFLGIQQLMMALASALTLSTTLADLVCAGPSDTVRSTLFSSTLLMTGLCTILQPMFGVRLPIFQGPSSSFLLPMLAMKNLGEWQCISEGTILSGINSTGSLNISSSEVTINSSPEEAMMGRLRQLQGSLMLASCFQLLIGCTGMIGFLLRYIGPITVVPTISLIGLSLFRVVLIYAPKQWGITFMTTALIIILSLFLKDYDVPIPSYRRKSGWSFFKFPIFKVFPIIIIVLIGWLLCHILTITGVFSEDKKAPNYYARTDVRSELIHVSPWVYVPYPCQFGLPSFNTGAFLGMLGATMASAIESVGDYYACAKICNVPPPPKHAINRGMTVEGFGSVIAGLFGTGHGTTSFSGNIGSIGITKVASRSVYYMAGVLTLVMAVIGKAAAVLVSIPYPVLGGVQIIIFGVLTSVGLSGLQYIDVKSSRNLTVLGVALFLGLLLPEWVIKTPGAIDTGYTQLDQIITVFIGTPMLIGGVVALILDNVVPGTIEERGMKAWQAFSGEPDNPENVVALKIYDPPLCVTRVTRRFSVSRYLPFLPTHRPDSIPSHEGV